MKKRTLRAKIGYWVDRMMSKGPISMSVLLFSVTSILVAVIGIVAYFVSDDGGLIYQIWESLMFTLDAGNLAGVPTDNIPYLALMFLSTLCGLFLTSVLVGIVATGVEDKLSDLRKGTSVVQEDDHTVIIGFDNNIYTLLRELIEANATHKKACVVVLGEQSKEEMEDAIAAHIPDTRTTKIICRSGKLHEAAALRRCSLETCKSVMVNVHDDAETVKVILALTASLKDKQLRHPDLKYVAFVQNTQYMESAMIAGEGRARVFHTKSAIARIIANTCRQHGLSQVLTDLFGFSGDELYFETIPQLTGKTFKEALMCFSNAVVFGLYKKQQVTLNPPMDTVICKDDQLILLEKHDKAYKFHDAFTADDTHIQTGASVAAQASNQLVVLGSNEELPMILKEYDQYVQPGSQVIVVDDDMGDITLGEYENLQVQICSEPVSRKLLQKLAREDARNMLLLNDDSLESEASDSQTLLRLILLRDIADKTDLHFSITTEMRSADNQRLASQARVDDFVIGSNFTSLLLAQLSENPQLQPLFRELLNEEGSELYMKPVSNYVALGQEVDFYTLTESAARKGEVFVGYRQLSVGNPNVISNPNKADRVVFGQADQVVVIAQD